MKVLCRIHTIGIQKCPEDQKFFHSCDTKLVLTYNQHHRTIQKVFIQVFCRTSVVHIAKCVSFVSPYMQSLCPLYLEAVETVFMIFRNLEDLLIAVFFLFHKGIFKLLPIVLLIQPIILQSSVYHRLLQWRKPSYIEKLKCCGRLAVMDEIHIQQGAT